MASLATITVSSQYGYCIIVAVLSTFVLMWKGFKVGQARKKYKIDYPTMYSPDNNQFNCYQRAHQNTLENYPQFLLLLLLGGLEWPLCSAMAGAVWLGGRIVYAQGYYSGDPGKRMKGAFAYLGLLVLLVATLKLGLRLSGCL